MNIPLIDTQGFFTFSPPFDSEISSDRIHTLKSVRSISDYLNDGVSVLETIYRPYGVEDDYPAHVENDTILLGLVSQNGTRVIAPSPYLLGFSLQGGVPYQTYALVIGLAPLPTSTAFDALIASLTSVVQQHLGAFLEIAVAETSEVTMLSEERHVEVQTERDLLKAPYGPDYLLAQSESALATAQLKIQSLETYILSLA